MPAPKSKSKQPAKKAAKPTAKPDGSPKDDDAKKGEASLSLKELLEKYDSDENLPGEHKVEGSDFTGDVARRGRFRRRSSPSMRAPAAATSEDCSLVHLVEKNGILSWQIGEKQAISPTPGFRAGPRRALIQTPGEVVRSFEFEKIPGSKATAALVALDKKLTPDADYGSAHNKTGLTVWDAKNGAFVPVENEPLSGKKVLLIIHGTFSNTKAFLNPTFRSLLNDAADQTKGGYDFVLAFDHPTLSVSPMLNAFDLAARLRDRGDPKQIDIICHSRGGLVTRWYCEAFAPAGMDRRAILVGCPLGGTSLAAPHRIREVFNLLTNVSRVGSVAAGFFGGPFFLAAKGIMGLTASLTGALAGPMTDVVVSLIPGLDSQSRTGNNQELLRLHANTGTAPFSSGKVRYWSILSNFEPDTSGAWGFLRSFSRPLQTLANRGADFVFEGPNDLVVDTASMTEASRGRNVIEVLHDFGTNDKVHHTNYFDHETTLLKIREAFKI